ncbi:Bro-N domain-containing protein [Bacillus paralicheniformis]|uniref:BRO-N domain-containing protein n=1 Tax=Bacillus subtilis group TaxID=653685 RepID=UPI0020A01124|nr:MULTISPECIES: Bro-N domain-containing protein [Bacillus subtilis group]MCV9368968.1 Bro-N domain-containing protein [Bacillus paralicheniformis]MCY7743688.1 Bro-N domain-containing protein [Bacillus licheniformis]MEB3127480.1 Bro-N domain-containing protein [Bacillus paralicheniformis]WIG07432.1 Bro-N domain-containing protein [Bacillus paralicheniformis]
MHQLQKVFNYQDQQVRTVVKDGEPWFVAKDVCDVLGITDARKSVNLLDEDERNSVPVTDSLGRNQETFIINEPGLYSLILRSRKPEAKQFKRWITHEVIPTIRKTGSYQMEQPKTPLEVLQGTINQLVEHDKRMNQLEGQVNNISNIVSMNNVGWREKVNVILKRIAKNWTGVEPYRSVMNLSYERLEQRAGCKLDIRLNNRKERALSQGMSKTYVKKINKLDVIAEEKRLVEIYIQIVKEMAIQFKVNINDFKFDEVI